MTKEENETIIQWDEATDIATIYTCSSPVMNRCRKLGLNLMEEIKTKRGTAISRTYEINKKLISLRKPRKKRVLTAKEKENFLKRIKKTFVSSKIYNIALFYLVLGI